MYSAEWEGEVVAGRPLGRLGKMFKISTASPVGVIEYSPILNQKGGSVGEGHIFTFGGTTGWSIELDKNNQSKPKWDLLRKLSPGIDVTRQRAWRSARGESTIFEKALYALTVQAPKNLCSEWFDEALIKKTENFEDFALENVK
ncbi:hypothetical protein [Microbulbifer sp. JMSA008]|uniref:hypothetical protein n=1 Tax=Microbulbifer sp. JMSA008 TaxID=3243373 RepID=UPI0040392454